MIDRYFLVLCVLLGLSACNKDKPNASVQQMSDAEKQFVAYMESDEYKLAVETERKRIEAEHKIIEEAPWFGKTGLNEETERHLPRYLRLEFGESLFDPDSLKAADLTYLGAFPSETGDVTHYWHIPSQHNDVYARVIVSPIHNSVTTDWGQEAPPE